MKHFISLVILTFLLALSETSQSMENQSRQLVDRINQTIERLQLSDEQVNQVKPILAQSIKTRMNILSKYGIDPHNRTKSDDNHSPVKKIGFRKARQLSNELSNARENTLAQLSEILSDAQLSDYKKIQIEARENFKQQMKSAR
ncbi:hypothetical protein [Aliikangiella coralliicola]|uniref:LTXXQ motif family protein n=1 Tax=Aliikangiella coralliicola TaxID=2592383 RepID=A0A545UJ30_9GAMM|nr:hypothetical protein [Aliikangiella coralliicola]TQV89468.1 hypothetical protein FLL46_00890 [Aliikangiella coralliicola]